LDRLTELRDQHERVLQDMVMDILRALTSPDLDVRQKTLDLALDLVSSRNVTELVKFLEKEVQRSADGQGHDDNERYRQLLVRTLHSISVRFPDVAPDVIPVLMDFLSDANELAAADVMNFVREAIQRYANLKPLIIEKLLEAFPTIRNIKIVRSVLWILGEYCDTNDSILDFMIELRKSIGEVPIVASEVKKAAGDEEENTENEEKEKADKPKKSGPRVTADGTYITQSALVTSVTKEDSAHPPLRGFLLDGEFFIGSVLATTLTKLGLRFIKLTDHDRKRNAFLAECMLIMTSILHLGKSGYAKKQIPDDDSGRISACIKVLSDPNDSISNIFSEESRKALSNLLQAKGAAQQKEKKVEKKKLALNQPDEPISFAQLMVRDGNDALVDELQASLTAAVSGGPTNDKHDPLHSKLNKVEQLTGFSDPVYAEAYVHVNQYDIVLDVLIVNQTKDTLQSVTLELATLGDLKLVEKPTPLTLAPHDFANIKASVKVTSTENAIIFGNIVYDITGSQSDRNCVVLNDIKIDIMDYIQPAYCSDQEFREMWAGFEWENKVTVHTNIGDLRDYLHHLVTSTNMKCLTPEKTLTGDCEFLAANLYAKSMFGESALANLSIEVGHNGFVQGHIRIRAKSQGMAISLGDKINESQKKQT
jgi:coatomer subunit beta